MKDDRLYLKHILRCPGRLAQESAKGEAEFRASETVQEAILMNLAIIGEAAKRVSTETRERAPRVPWREVARLRDVIIHRYDHLDLSEIRDIVRLDVLPFTTQVEALVQDLGAPDQSRAESEPDAPCRTEG